MPGSATKPTFDTPALAGAEPHRAAEFPRRDTDTISARQRKFLAREIA
jgi:hypothetical protein